MKPINFIPFGAICVISIACIIIFSLIMQNQAPTVQKVTTQEEVLTDEPMLKTLFEETLDIRKILVGHTWRFVGTDYWVLITFSPNNIHLKILSPANFETDLITTGTWKDIGENKVKLQYFDYEVQTLELKIQSKIEFTCGTAVYELYGT